MRCTMNIFSYHLRVLSLRNFRIPKSSLFLLLIYDCLTFGREAQQIRLARVFYIVYDMLISSNILAGFHDRLWDSLVGANKI